MDSGKKVQEDSELEFVSSNFTFSSPVADLKENRLKFSGGFPDSSECIDSFTKRPLSGIQKDEGTTPKYIFRSPISHVNVFALQSDDVIPGTIQQESDQGMGGFFKDGNSAETLSKSDDLCEISFDHEKDSAVAFDEDLEEDTDIYFDLPKEGNQSPPNYSHTCSFPTEDNTPTEDSLYDECFASLSSSVSVAANSEKNFGCEQCSTAKNGSTIMAKREKLPNLEKSFYFGNSKNVFLKPPIFTTEIEATNIPASQATATHAKYVAPTIIKIHSEITNEPPLKYTSDEIRKDSAEEIISEIPNLASTNMLGNPENVLEKPLVGEMSHEQDNCLFGTSISETHISPPNEKFVEGGVLIHGDILKEYKESNLDNMDNTFDNIENMSEISVSFIKEETMENPVVENRFDNEDSIAEEMILLSEDENTVEISSQESAESEYEIFKSGPTIDIPSQELASLPDSEESEYEIFKSGPTIDIPSRERASLADSEESEYEIFKSGPTIDIPSRELASLADSEESEYEIFKSGPTIDIPSRELASLADSKKNYQIFTSKSTSKDGFVKNVCQCIQCKGLCLETEEVNDDSFDPIPESDTSTASQTEKRSDLSQISFREDVEVLLNLFEVDNKVSKGIILALSGKFSTNGASKVDMMTHLRNEPFSGTLTKLKEDTYAFFNAAVDAGIIERKNRRYVLKFITGSGSESEGQKNEQTLKRKLKNDDDVLMNDKAKKRKVNSEAIPEAEHHPPSTRTTRNKALAEKQSKNAKKDATKSTANQQKKAAAQTESSTKETATKRNLTARSKNLTTERSDGKEIDVPITKRKLEVDTTQPEEKDVKKKKEIRREKSTDKKQKISKEKTLQKEIEATSESEKSNGVRKIKGIKGHGGMNSKQLSKSVSKNEDKKQNAKRRAEDINTADAKRVAKSENPINKKSLPKRHATQLRA